MAAIIQNAASRIPKSRYLSFWISYLGDLSGLIKVFWTKEYNAKQHYTVKWFFRGFWSVLISIVWYFGKIVWSIYATIVIFEWLPPRMSLSSAHCSEFTYYHDMKLNHINYICKHHLHYNTALLCCGVCKTTNQGVNIIFSGKLTVWHGVL